ncbi:hypothetical protein [Calothrix sp. UHCC 0171]|uniref:hypothetical protein n=1 Tax=Calothrix sp. UHCC 0171 TaxID=3110245 RepID=UPI002B1F3C2D|nr:hypothetical protein [Calothrix sp. UHCC 0171]MEA5572143.1 hypothetical protein [Calothrix sp. UHCC 0171]
MINFAIAIFNEQDKLYLQATGQPKVQLFPESEIKFFIKEVDAQVTFVKSQQGVVTNLILHQNGINQNAKKVE